MELSVALSALQSVANKLNLYYMNRDVYDISINGEEVRLMGDYNNEFAKNIALAKLDNFKQLPIDEFTGFIRMTFTCNDVNFTIVLT